MHRPQQQCQDQIGRDHHSLAEVVSPSEIEDWNSALHSLPEASVFHTRQWAEVLQQTYSYRPCYLRARAKATTSLLLPVMEARSWLVGERGISLPFTDECTVLQSGTDTAVSLLREVRRIPAANRWRSWEYRGGAFHPSAAPPSQTHFGHQLEVSGEPAALFASLEGAVRTSLRKAHQHEVVATAASDVGAMQIFYRQLCETRRRHGLPPQPYRFFAEIQRALIAAGLGFVVVAVHRGIPVASAVFLHFGEKAIYKFAASDFRFRHLQANHVVLWQGIQECRHRGCRILDFGRTSRTNAGLRKFKLAWRPRERSIDYVKYDLRRDCYIEAERELTTGWHNRLFRMLPLPISKAIGALAYRHLA